MRGVQANMKISKVICCKGRTGFFFDDQKAIQTTAVSDGAAYSGVPVTKGFKAVRQAGESISVMLILEDGQIAHGDCAAVQYSGVDGRDPLFLADEFIPVIENEIAPLLIGREITEFKGMAELVESYTDSSGERMHTGVRYGVTQALLDARAKSEKKIMAQIVAEEYGLKISEDIIPIFTQSGDDRYNNTDKMILKSVNVLPHALFNKVDKLGKQGELLVEYIVWLKRRIIKLRPYRKYEPVFHIDVYGRLGEAFNNDMEKIADYLGELESLALPNRLRIEGPVDMSSLKSQMEALRDLRVILDEREINVELVADEWCNTLDDIRYFTDNKAGHMIQIKTPDLGGINNSIEAVLYCKEHGMGAYLGGTCNETDRSAQVCAHIAMATSPVQILAKPGMGVDEAYMIGYNEMERILALVKGYRGA